MKKIYATRLRWILTSLILCCAATQTKAFTITPTHAQTEQSGVRYYFLVDNWGLNDPARSPCSTDDALLTLCGIEIGAFRGPQSLASVGTTYHWDVPARQGFSTLGELRSDLEKKGLRIPLNGSILVPFKSITENLCISMTYVKVGGTTGGGVSFFGPCKPVANQTQQCDINGDTTIDHKSLPDNALDGATASTKLFVLCRGSNLMNVKASRTNSSGVRLRSDGSLYSNLRINGNDATQGILVATENNLASTLTITSTLRPLGTVTPGEFSGSTVITVSPY